MISVIHPDDAICHYNENYILHRIDGPAAEFPDGSRRWYINGEELTEAQFNSKLYRLLYT
jgi:hypothetical protein